MHAREKERGAPSPQPNTIFLHALLWAMRGEHRNESRVFLLEEEEQAIRRVRGARQWLEKKGSPVTLHNLIHAISTLFPQEAEALLIMQKTKRALVERLAQQSIHPLSFKKE